MEEVLTISSDFFWFPRRFYPLFAVVGNLAPIVSGKVMSAIVALQVSSDDAAFGQTLKYLVGCMVIKEW